MSQFLQEILPCSQTTSLFFNVSRMTFWLGVKPSPSATSLNRTSKRVMCFVSDVYFCTIEVTATSTVTLDTLTEKHAEQENMTLTELKKVIADIYPDQTQFYVIEFKCL